MANPNLQLQQLPVSTSPWSATPPGADAGRLRGQKLPPAKIAALVALARIIARGPHINPSDIAP